MDIKEVETVAKKEALGWVELTEDPAPITVAGCKRTLKRAALGFFPVALVFIVLGALKLLNLLPTYDGGM